MRFPKPSLPIPTLSPAQRRVVDRLLLSEYGLSALQWQENAGLALAEVAREAFLKGNTRDKGIAVLAGQGMKGAVALACARRLHAWGAKVRICHNTEPNMPTELTAPQMHTLQRMAVLSIPEPAHGAALVIDGLADYGADISVRTLALIDWCNMQIQPVLSIDLPSGLDAATGAHTPTHCVRASATLALGLPLEGIFTQKARPMVGEIFLADMGIPKTLFAAPGVEMEVRVYFSESAILKLR